MVLRTRDIARVLFGWEPRDNVASRETAWMDGVRGVAAFLVMINHYSMEWLSQFSDAPFGAVVLSDRNPDGVWYHKAGDRLWAPWRLPIFRLFMVSGGAQVSIFFVLSGMVLAWSPVGSIQAGNYEKVYQSLGSSTIRRWFRLFLPCAIVSLAYLAHHIARSYDGIGPMLSSIWDYVVVTYKWANPFETDHITQFSTNHNYNFVMWTIPFEFAGSIFVYVSMLGLGRVQSYHRRTIALIIVSLYAMFSLNWGYWLFGAGICIADYVRHAGGFRSLSEHTSPTSRWWWTFAFIAGLMLMGYVSPMEWYSRPGYEWMESIPLPEGWRFLIGAERFWWGWGGMLVILSSCHLTFIRHFFELAFIQHLGTISFMLYLIHFLINQVFALPLRHTIYVTFCPKEWDDSYDSDVFRTSSLLNVAVHFVLWAVCIPVVMIVSHFLEVWVDRPCTKFGKWVDDILMNGFTRMSEKSVEEEERLLVSPADVRLEMGELPRR